MGLFRYEAVDKTGKVVHGAMNARDEQQVAQNLASMGYSVRAINSGGGAPNAAPSRATSVQAPPSVPAPSVRGGKGIASVTVASGVPVSIKSRVGLPELAKFFRHMATLVKSGIPVTQAFSDMAPAVHNSRLKKVLPKMQEATQGGNKMSGLMAEHPDIFPVHTIASVYAGELSGKLEIALDEIATDLEQEAVDTRIGRIGWALTKANIIFFALLIPMANIDDLLLPTAQAAMKTGGQGMDTRGVLLNVLITWIHTMLPKSLIVIAAMIAIWIVWGLLKRVPTVRRLLDGLLLSVPGWGPLHRDRAIGRFLHVLDGLYAAGINPNTAWDAASLAPKNSYIAEKLRLARTSLPQNAGISQMMASAGVLSPEDIALVSSGEKTGQVPEVLANLSRGYDTAISGKKGVLRVVAITILVVAVTILGGYIAIRVTQTYFDMVFKIGDMFGQP